MGVREHAADDRVHHCPVPLDQRGERQLGLFLPSIGESFQELRVRQPGDGAHVEEHSQRLSETRPIAYHSGNPSGAAIIS